jgi:hypothetical protein
MERQGPDPIDNQTVVSTETKLHGPRIRSPRPVLATASMVVLVAGIIGSSAAWVRSTGPGIHSERVSTIGASRTNADPSAFPGGSPTPALAEMTGHKPSPIPKPSPLPSPTTVPVHKSGPEPTGEPAPRPTPKPAPRSTATLTGPGPVLLFNHVDGLTVTGNHQPISHGSLTQISDSTHVTTQ